MSKIRNQNGSGNSKLGGYVGPVESGRGGSRKTPSSFSGAAPPSSSFSRLSFIKKQIIAAFFVAINFFAMPSGTILFTGCSNGTTDTTNQPPTAYAGGNQNVTLVNNLTVTLDGTLSTDQDDGIASYAWTYVSHAHDKGTVITPYSANDVKSLMTPAGDGKVNLALRKAGTYNFQLTVTDKSGEAATSNVTVTVNPMNANQNVTVAAGPAFSADTKLALQLPGSNYSFAGAVDSNFSAGDLDGIAYTLTSTNPAKTATQLASYISDGKLVLPTYPEILYDDGEYPTITQTFYYNGQEVGSRKFVVRVCTGVFSSLYGYIPTEFSGTWYDSDFVDISTIPNTTLTLKKAVTELP